MELYSLRPENIDSMSRSSYEFLTGCKIPSRDAHRLQLLIEESLLKYRDNFPENTEVRFNQTKLLGSPVIRLEIVSAEFNPFASETEDGLLMDSLLQGYSGTPSFRYRNGRNILVFTGNKKETSTLVKVGIAILAGSIVGSLMKLLPRDTVQYLTDSFLSPLADVFPNLLCVMAVLMTFLAISLGIVHAGNLSSASTVYKKLIKSFLLVTLSMVLIVILFTAFPLIRFGYAGTSSLDPKALFDLIIDCFPSNPVYPFLNFKTVQLVIIAVMFGVSMLLLGDRAHTMRDLFDESNSIAVMTNSFINRKLVAVYVFLLFTKITATMYLDDFKSIGLVMLKLLAALAVILIIGMAVFGLRLRRNPLKLSKHLMPTFLINLGSDNFAASFTTNIECLINDYGIDPDFAGMGLNIGCILFKPASMVFAVTVATITARMNNIPITFFWVLTLVLVSLLLTSTLPNIPGILFTVITLLGSHIGITNDGLSTALIIAPLMSSLVCAINGLLLQQCLIIEAVELKKIDLKKLD